MKTPITWLSIGLLASGFTAAGVVSFLAWDSLTARTELSKHPTLAPIPIATESPAPLATSVVQTLPADSTNPSANSLGQDENNYLFDLSQGLQTDERDRLTAEQQLAIAQNILGWLKEGADYWGVREKFDAAYRGQILGDYAHNRDVYIRFATQWLAPDHLATLKQPGTTEVATEVPSSPLGEITPGAAFDSYPDTGASPDYTPAPSYASPPDYPYGAPGFDPYAAPYPMRPGPYRQMPGFRGGYRG